MAQQKPSWHFDQVAGAPLALHGRQVTPIARVLRIEWLGARFTWQHPLAVEVRDETATYRLAVPNMTRRALVGMVLALGVLAVLAARWNRTRTA
ncbi:MAG TPA: hypothetical protein VGP82_25000 [Ktedonobacterales bacterium]|jgi:hypothetical protein|nr:hypothetical protein [Ktedonobacterales bacterium]